MDDKFDRECEEYGGFGPGDGQTVKQPAQLFQQIVSEFQEKDRRSMKLW